MDRISDQYDGARRKGECRIKSYRVTFGDGHSTNVDFTEIQANSIGAVLEPDGIAINAAITLVNKWNEMAKWQGNALRYGIPFIKAAVTNP